MFLSQYPGLAPSHTDKDSEPFLKPILADLPILHLLCQHLEQACAENLISFGITSPDYHTVSLHPEVNRYECNLFSLDRPL